MKKWAVKRKVERIRLAAPIIGRVGNMNAALVDVSLLGCRLEHHLPLTVGNPVKLFFNWEHEELELECVVARCTLTRFASGGTDGLSIYNSGLRFTDARGESPRALRRLLATHIAQALEEQKANARGDIPKFIEKMAIFTRDGFLTLDPNAIAEMLGGSTSLPALRIAREKGYVNYSMENGSWRRRRTHEPDQPDEGFTVWAYEDEEQLEKLCSAYAKSDSDMRALIRGLAELSLSVDDSLPPQRFTP